MDRGPWQEVQKEWQGSQVWEVGLPKDFEGQEETHWELDWKYWWVLFCWQVVQSELVGPVQDLQEGSQAIF